MFTTADLFQLNDITQVIILPMLCNVLLLTGVAQRYSHCQDLSYSSKVQVHLYSVILTYASYSGPLLDLPSNTSPIPSSPSTVTRSEDSGTRTRDDASTRTRDESGTRTRDETSDGENGEVIVCDTLLTPP